MGQDGKYCANQRAIQTQINRIYCFICMRNQLRARSDGRTIILFTFISNHLHVSFQIAMYIFISLILIDCFHKLTENSEWYYDNRCTHCLDHFNRCFSLVLNESLLVAQKMSLIKNSPQYWLLRGTRTQQTTKPTTTAKSILTRRWIFH